MGEQEAKERATPATGETDLTEFSNTIRLTGREWILVGAFAALLVVLAPWLWEQKEVFVPGADYRIPHELGNDYWLYERYAGLAAKQYDTLLIGDSVLWGEYVTRENTLSHFLNRKEGRQRYANLGLDGTHPLALAGLVEHYAGSVTGKKVVLQWNALWMSSARRDLQDEEYTDFNHPRLVPQFFPSLPSYPYEKTDLSTRIGIEVERQLPFNSWTNHLQQAYYGASDIPGWTLEHPYESPLAPLRDGLPPSDETLRQLPVPWFEKGIKKEDFPWVDPETSLQWHAFQRMVQLLERRGNRVFVLVGPFNEHMLEPESRARLAEVKRKVARWLEAEGIAYRVMTPLPSELYADASHPLAAGYEMLAGELLHEPFFASGAP